MRISMNHPCKAFSHSSRTKISMVHELEIRDMALINLHWYHSPEQQELNDSSVISSNCLPPREGVPKVLVELEYHTSRSCDRFRATGNQPVIMLFITLLQGITDSAPPEPVIVQHRSSAKVLIRYV